MTSEDQSHAEEAQEHQEEMLKDDLEGAEEHSEEKRQEWAEGARKVHEAEDAEHLPEADGKSEFETVGEDEAPPPGSPEHERGGVFRSN